MTRLFGYMFPNVSLDVRASMAEYAARVTGIDIERKASAAQCIASQTCEDGPLRIAFAGRPRFRGSLLRSAEKSSFEQFIKTFRDSGIAVLDDLSGPFAICILDPEKAYALLAIDQMGIERLAYQVKSDCLVFGDRADDVANVPDWKSNLRDQGIYDFLLMHMIPAPNTIYTDVYKLPPATALIYRSGECQQVQYWKPEYNFEKRPDISRLRQELKGLLRCSIRDCGIDSDTGAFLSGGLDSSSVAGTFAQICEDAVSTFTVGFDEAGYDELEYARIASKFFGCRMFYYQVTPADIVDAFPRIAIACDEPFGNSSAVPTYYCAKLAAENGMTHLLAGDGGDELFGGNERYVRHQLFEYYFRLPGAVRKAVLEPLSRNISPATRIAPLRKLRSYIDQALIPLPERFESWNFMYRVGPLNILDPQFAAEIDPDGPLQIMREVWDAAPSEDLLERMLWYDWRFTLADNDLRKVGRMCELAGIRVSYPMIDSRLVTFSTRIPSRMKVRGLELRSFYKRAMADFLPEEIIRKKKHGFGLPFGPWLNSNNQLRELIYSYLDRLKQRRIIAVPFIDDLLTADRRGDASYYGYAIWDLAMLEAWMSSQNY